LRAGLGVNENREVGSALFMRALDAAPHVVGCRHWRPLYRNDDIARLDSELASESESALVINMPATPGLTLCRLRSAWRWCTCRIEGEMTPAWVAYAMTRWLGTDLGRPGRQHQVQDSHADGSLSLLGSEAARSHARSDQSFITAHRRFDCKRPPMTAYRRDHVYGMVLCVS